MKYMILFASIIFLVGCSNKTVPDRTNVPPRAFEQLAMTKLELAGQTFTTANVPQTIAGSTLKKVAVNVGGRYEMAFIEPDQAARITRKDQQVFLYVLEWSTGSSWTIEWIKFARAI